jgi:hypothetical protein
MDEARERREEWSETMDSGDDESDDTEGANDERRPVTLYTSEPLKRGAELNTSNAMRVMQAFCAVAMAEHIDGRLDPGTDPPTAGVDEAMN